jgi:hypothetical protein
MYVCVYIHIYIYVLMQISDRVAKWVIRDWVCGQHQEQCHSISGQRHAKSFLSKLSAKRTIESLKFNRIQAIRVTGLLPDTVTYRAISSNWK